LHYATSPFGVAVTAEGVARNKFMVVVTAEADTTVTTRAGPAVLSGISPSSWMQPLLTHALFRGIPPG
jgi:hypothetical protein